MTQRPKRSVMGVTVEPVLSYLNENNGCDVHVEMLREFCNGACALVQQYPNIKPRLKQVLDSIEVASEAGLQ